jgi:hypothetical protein
LVDLEPYVAAAVPGLGGLTAGDLGHVELHGTGVRDGGYRAESYGVTGLCLVSLVSLRTMSTTYIDGVCACARAGREGVAADSIGSHIRDRAVGLVVRRLANILPRTGSLATDNELGEGVVRRDGARKSEERKNDGLHSESEALSVQTALDLAQTASLPFLYRNILRGNYSNRCYVHSMLCLRFML